MKLLHLLHSVDPGTGGTIEGVRQLSEELVRQGHQVELACLNAAEAPFLSAFPFPIHALGPGRGVYGYSPRLLPWLKTNAPRFDVLLVNGLWQYTGLAARGASLSTAVPYTVFTHGMLDPWFKRRYPFKHLKKWLYWPWGEYRVLRDARTVFFTSEQERLDARNSFWLYRCREEVLGYGIASPPADFAAQRALFLEIFPALAGRRLLLFLGRMHEKKGCDLLLRAFRRLLDGHPGSTDSVHLVMAGPADHAYGQKMQALAVQLGLKDRVTWTGMLAGARKWGALHAADAFVLPSHQENFGVSVVEALACGLSVLVSNKVNIWREVEEAGAGWIGHDDEAGTLGLLERWLRQTSEERLAMRASARVCFDQNFQVEQVARRLVASLEKSTRDRRRVA